MADITQIVKEVEEYVDLNKEEVARGLIPDYEDLVLEFKHGYGGHDKRGYLYTTSPLDYIVNMNKELSLRWEEPVSVESTLTLMQHRLNALLENREDKDEGHITWKLSHFSENHGTIYVYFSDHLEIENLKTSFTSEEDDIDAVLCTLKTEDPDLVDKDCPLDEKDEDEEMEFEEVNSLLIGKVESPFRESNGVPTAAGFLFQAVAKIHLGSLSENLKEELCNWKYALIQHIFLKDDEFDFTEINEEMEEASKVDLSSASSYSFALIEKYSIKQLWISGAKIMHNSYIIGIFPVMNPMKPFEVNQKAFMDCFNQKIFERIFDSSINSESPENIIEKEIQNFSSELKSVVYSETVIRDLSEIVEQKKLDFYSSTKGITSAINTILSLNPESIQTKTKDSEKVIHAIAFDNITIIYEERENSVHVFKIMWSTYFIETKSQHSQEWLSSISNALNLEKLLIGMK